MKDGRRPDEAGYTLLALLASIAIGLVLMAAAAPTWDYLVKDSNEEELLFRGKSIADAIQRYQRKNANALPPSLEVLVQGKYLRKAYKDPMTKGGKWRFVRAGEAAGVAPVAVPGLPTAPTTTTRPAAPTSSTVGGVIGVIQGVASTSEEKALRIVNGRTRYNEWVFLPGQALVVGRAPGPVPVPGGGVFPGARSPSPNPATTTPGRP